MTAAVINRFYDTPPRDGFYSVRAAGGPEPGWEQKGRWVWWEGGGRWMSLTPLFPPSPVQSRSFADTQCRCEAEAAVKSNVGSAGIFKKAAVGMGETEDINTGG